MSSKKRKKEKKKVTQQPTAVVKNTSQEKLTRSLALIIGAVAIILYIQTLNYGFVLDDYSAIIENHVTQEGLNAIPTIFKTSYRFGYPIQGDELYRPIPKSIFAILWQLFPNNPLPGHLLNIVLYALTGIFLFITLSRLIPQNIYIPFIASVLFIAHPIHTEVVANIKSLDEILSFFLFVLSLFLIEKFFATGRKRWMLLAVISYFISLLSKESAITYLAIYPLMIYFFTNKSVAKNFQITALMLIPALMFLIIRYQVVGVTGASSMADNALLATQDFLVRKATAIYILGLYLKLLVFPHVLTFDYSYNQIPLIGIGDWKLWISAGVYTGLLIFAIRRFRKKDFIAFGILFYFITLSISSNLIIYIGTHMAERLLYVPSFGFCFAVATLMEKLIQKKDILQPGSLKSFFLQRSVLSGMVTVIVLLYSLKTWAQNPVWKSNEALYESGVLRSPGSHRTHFYLGNFLLKKSYYSQFPEAKQEQIIQRGLTELRKSAAIHPGFADAWLHLGNYFSELHQNDSATFYFQKAIQIAPYLATAHNNLGTVYFDQKQFGKAIDEFAAAIRNDPNYVDAYRNLGSAYGTIGKYREAIAYFSKALQLAPTNAEVLYYLGITYQNLGDTRNARIFLDKAASLDAKYRK